MREPEVALAFTADPWIEELHRYVADHGGARVRCVLVEREVALEESYDVLVAAHRWPALTRALIAEVRGRGRAVVGVYDREEPASRNHLAALGIEATIASDVGCEALVRAIVAAASTNSRGEGVAPVVPATRETPLVVVGGGPGTGRTEIAIQLARMRSRAVLVDVDDVAPAIAQRLALTMEPNLRNAIDAVEHGHGELRGCLQELPGGTGAVLCGLPNARAWAQIRPGEVVRVIDRLPELGACDAIVVDGAGLLEVVGPAARTRFGTGRAMVAEADVLVATSEASPHGVTRLLAWIADARTIAPEVPVVVVVNRAPESRFVRAEIYAEITDACDVVGVVFCPVDTRVGRAAWRGVPVDRGAFTRACEALAEAVLT